MRVLPILKDGYYHVYNRGVQKQVICHDKADYARLLFLLLYMQAPVSISHINRYIKNYIKTEDFAVGTDLVTEIKNSRLVEVVNFCIMPNHFHIVIHTLSDDAVGVYMQKVGNAYSKYYNKRYERSGHVFQGAYKIKEIFSDNDLAYLSAYVHRNPNEMRVWRDIAVQYPWSSYRDMRQSRWGALLCPDIIMDRFESFAEYNEYVESSGAKEDFGDF